MGKGKNMEDKGQNLCDACSNCFATCNNGEEGTDFFFGTGLGNDNVYKCKAYIPDTNKIMEFIREECSGCENWSGSDCTLFAPDAGCPYKAPSTGATKGEKGV
jgi:hypothetical protein